MEKNEFTANMKRLFDYFGREPSPALMREWWAELQYEQNAVMHDAVSSCLHELKHLPTLGDFKRRVWKARPRKPEQQEAENNVVVPQGELDFVSAAMPYLAKWFEWNARKAKGKAPESVHTEGFEKLMTEIRGLAIKHRVAHLINWSQFSGICGFKPPATWTHADGRPDYESDQEEY